ncbi:hypothetical protein LEP1GSC202_1984 [Leptospira yanagawae serovar Saopaulo str. Sao Paulo = ATCC 700523]|uniref:Uncharacterized protein n=1 Tax=Leptospira yanagawae serovar Saopaulo str. Sao Paulo = ATCC 700523 TaxID=1249483 RepID=A0A5E8HE87_9LEPT|nr:hypothetical protein LEP1GSC202_1984 [Leptospira yanagawae serovar Saopaulo str. Sao Paulo = ATCC 700523]
MPICLMATEPKERLLVKMGEKAVEPSILRIDRFEKRERRKMKSLREP